MSPGGKTCFQFRKPLVTNQKDYTSFQALELRVSAPRHSRVAPTRDMDPLIRTVWGPNHQNVGVLQNTLFLLGWDCLLMSLICGPLS